MIWELGAETGIARFPRMRSAESLAQSGRLRTHPLQRRAGSLRFGDLVLPRRRSNARFLLAWVSEETTTPQPGIRVRPSSWPSGLWNARTSARSFHRYSKSAWKEA